jgi:AraC family transcriptional regulator, transcriptional activator of the genes for pyochelin and ferripyochelin receptors
MAISSTNYTNLLTPVDLEELLEQAQQQGESIFQQEKAEVRENLPRQLGDGGDRLISLRNGLTIHIRNARLWQPIWLKQQHESTFPLTAKFYLSGSSRVQTQGMADVQANYEETAGCNYLYCLPDLTEIEEWQANELIQVVMIYARADYFRSFNLTDDALPKPLQELIKSGSTRQFYQSFGKITPAMYQVLQQILHCPYQGLIQQLYLESKALELLSMQFAHWNVEDSVLSQPASKQTLLRSDDVERLQHAKEILIQHITSPPSLIELAHQVGLNDRKLKQGFRHLFGTTVFGYLKDYRMQRAKQLLHDTDLSIAAIAATIGYRNPEAFSIAFRREFAVSPKGYQLSQRAQLQSAR